ncbi:tripartite tricarboxylate transporter substrate binding protein [Spelaeicoccus albus]
MGGVATATTLLAGCRGTRDSSSSSEEGFPKHGLTMIAAGSPGGGLDTATRTLQSGFKATDIDANFKVENIGGGGGNPARAALLKRPNDGYSVVVESDRIYLSPLMNTTKMQVKDFTPLASLTSDYEVWVVKSGSKFKTAKDVLKAAKKNPKSVSFGVGTTPSDDQFNILLPAMHSGIKDISALNVVAFKEGGDLNTELLGGHVEVASTGLSEAITLAESGKFKILAVAAPKRVGSAKNVPTWKEQGLDVVIPHWRGVFGPANMPKEAVTWWKDSIKKATATDEFAKKTKNLDLTVDFVPGDKFLKNVIEPGRKDAKQIIKKLGIGK